MEAEGGKGWRLEEVRDAHNSCRLLLSLRDSTLRRSSTKFTVKSSFSRNSQPVCMVVH